jgi:O-antigen/teichoic acid export membrane protein
VNAEQEKRLASRNAVRLAASLLGTFVVAAAVRFWLPRAYGPTDFGRLHFSESLATLMFGLTAFGIDSYIGRAVARNTDHASEIFGGVVLVRLAVAMLLSFAVVGTLIWFHRTPTDFVLVGGYCAWQLLFVTNGSLAAFLNARGTVGELSVINVATKFLWGVGIIGVLLLHGAMIWIPAAFCVSEAVRLMGLLSACRKHLGLELRWQFDAGKAVLLASMPFFLTGLARRIYSQVDVYMLAGILGDQEVGWYGAAATFYGTCTLLIPVVSAVVLPMSSRISQSGSAAELNAVTGATVRLALVVSAPVSLWLCQYARPIVDLIFGSRFEHSAPALQLTAAIFPFSYVCTIVSMHLISEGHAWSVTRVSLFGLVANPTMNAILIPLFYMRLGAGGGAIGAALSSLSTEIFMTAGLMWMLQRRSIDLQLTAAATKLVGLLAVVASVGWWLPVDWRVQLAVQIVLYSVMGTWLGLIPMRGLLDAVREMVKAKPVM